MDYLASFLRVTGVPRAKLLQVSYSGWIRAFFWIGLWTSLITGCGTVPDAGPLIQTKFLYMVHTHFLGAHGPLTRQQGERIIERLQSHQEEPTDILERHLAFEQAISRAPLVVGNKVTLLQNGATSYKAMLQAIRGAHHNIDLEMYIISDGAVGQKFVNALIERRQHGVEINLIYDSVGSLHTSAAFFDNLRANGIAVVQFNPLSPFAAKHWSFRKLRHRDHRKMLIIDGRIAFTGGINISEVYASGIRSGSLATPPADWRDTDIEVAGPVVSEFQKLFVSDWYQQGGLPLDPRRYFPKVAAQGNQIVRVIGAAPEQFSLIYVDLISAVTNAETDVYITDAYFAPDHQMLRALKDAARRGVDVQLLLPGQTDEPFIGSAQRSHYEGLLKAGVRIYEWRGKMLHAKTATIDGVWSTVGTSNLDWWSIARNYEVNAIILGHQFGDDMGLMFKNDVEESQRIDLAHWTERPWLERFQEFCARIMQPLL
jgi:cardiolipin synthase